MKVIQRIQTILGPRTIVLQGLSQEHAYAMLHASQAVGGDAFVGEDGPQVSLRAYMRAASATRSSGKVTPIRKVRK